MEFSLMPVAQADVGEIFDHYAQMSAALANRFVSEFERTLRRLCLQPEVGSRRYARILNTPSVLVWKLSHFPYLVFYRVDVATLNVVRVLHERRKLTARMIVL